MDNYIKIFKKQLNELPEDDYKLQLIKYGEEISKDLIDKSIVGLISNIKMTNDNIEYLVDEIKPNYTKKIKSVNAEVPYDLGVYGKLLRENTKDTKKNIEDATIKACEFINNSFMNFICSENIKELHLTKDTLLNNQDSRIFIIGNEIFGLESPLKFSLDNKNLKFIGNYGNNLVYHSKFISPKILYSIEFNKDEKLINYVVKNPLTVINNKYTHIAGIKMNNPDLITKFKIIQ